MGRKTLSVLGGPALLPWLPARMAVMAVAAWVERQHEGSIGNAESVLLRRAAEEREAERLVGSLSRPARVATPVSA